MVDAGEAYRLGRLSQNPGDAAKGIKTDVIKVRNDSGVSRARGEVVGDFSTLLSDLTAESIWVAGDEPVLGKSFGVYLKDVPDGEIEECQVSGVCLAIVNVTDVGHERADISGTGHKLQSAADGPVELIFVPGGVAEQMCVVKLGGGGGSAAEPPIRHAFTKSGGINSRSTLTMGSASCDLYVSSGAGVLSDAGTDVTVYNPFSQSVAGDVHILISKNEAGLWVVIAEDCG
jgi:hypothetical protein